MSNTTIKQLIQSASILLADCSDSAKLDAQVILAHVLNKDTTYLITWSDKVLNDKQLASFNVLLERRIQGEPVAYLVGYKEFWSLPLAVAPSTLIPRPDTETLIELVLDRDLGKNLNVLDLGTGTGAIALALASEQPSWQVTAVDFNQEAVELAKRNVDSLGLANVKVCKSNWYSAFNQGETSKLDLIVSNPPYIDESDEHLDQGDVRYEPKSALVAKNKGLADIEIIVSQGRDFLSEQGSMYIEHGYNQGEAVRELFQRFNYHEPQTVKDLAGNDRITWAFFVHHNG